MTLSRKVSNTVIIISVGLTAVITAYLWKRKKPGEHCDTGGNKSCTAKQQLKENCKEPIIQTEKLIETKPETVEVTQDLKRSQSLPCGNNSTPARDSIDRQSGKSAPIDIAPNPRSPPKKLTEEQIDLEILKLKLNESDIKNLSSIEELADESSSVESSLNLPGSMQPCRFSSSMQKVQEEPVVVKAAKMTTKLRAERDSANQSPVESIDSNGNCKIVQEVEECTRERPIASPPLSLCSLQSTDSGQGSSPPQSEGGNIVYDFVVPCTLVQHLIGTKGRYVKQLKAKTGVRMTVLDHPKNKRLGICSMEGTHKEIDAALRMLRQKMPERRYPQVTLERVFLLEPNSNIPLPAIEDLQLPLIEGINNDVSICAVASGKVFLQQPLHPTYPQLSQLQSAMNQTYNCCEAPQLDKAFESAICVAATTTESGIVNWVRVQIVAHNPVTQSVLVKYLDYGGFGNYHAQDLRKIRQDFMIVPFQSIEVKMADIEPIDSNDGWHEDVRLVLLSLTFNKIIQAHLIDYTEDGAPEVHMYATLDNDKCVHLNDELVARGLAKYSPIMYTDTVMLTPTA